MGSIRELIGEAFEEGCSRELDASKLRDYGNRGNWYGVVEVSKSGLRRGEMAHARSLGNILLRHRVLDAYGDLWFRFTITTKLKLVVERLSEKWLCGKREDVETINVSIPKTEKRVIYVGDSNDVVSRILINHCSGNVEGSALRKAVAEAMGYGLRSAKRPSGSIKVRIDLPNSKEGEAKVSGYIRSGTWKYIICQSLEEAQDFQWYVIDQLRPLLNRNRRPWDNKDSQRYRSIIEQLKHSSEISCYDLRKGQAVAKTGPGVYVLYHDLTPKEWLKRQGQRI
ncbi:MAG: hypothetical protein QXU67_05065 [Candidatus Bathyarchaeia archaeon]